MSSENEASLSSLNLKYNVRSKSTLGSILKDYGLPEKKAHKKKKVSEPAQKPPRRYKDNYEDDRAREKRLYREKKSQQVVVDLDALKNHYYAQYMDILKERVKQQRTEIKHREDDLQRRLLQEKDDRNQQVRARLTKHDLTSDNSFLEGLPKSQFHEILARERKLLKEGKMKTLTDSELFWARELNIPTSIKDHSQRSGLSYNAMSLLDGRELESQSDIDLLSDNSLEHGQTLPNLDLYQIEEMSESRPNTRGQPAGTWAVTQQAQHKHKQSDKERQGGRKTKDDQEIQFKKVEMPRLHCFSMSLSKPPPDPVEERRKANLSIREQERRAFLFKLQKMYQHAMANTASANRILDKHDPSDLFLLLEGPNISDKTSHYSLKQIMHREEDIDPNYYYHQTWPPEKYAIATIPEERESEIPTRQSFGTNLTTRDEITERSGSGGSWRSSVKKQKHAKHSESRPRTTDKLTPLTMNQLVKDRPEEAKIMESKQLSSLWINYTKPPLGKEMAANT